MLAATGIRSVPVSNQGERRSGKGRDVGWQPGPGVPPPRVVREEGFPGSTEVPLSRIIPTAHMLP